MERSQREMTIYTPDKMYKGQIDVPNDSLRTIDIFNSTNIYWKDPAKKSFDNAILLNRATVVLEGNSKLGDFDTLQVNLSDVLFFHDSLENLSDSVEKKRAAHMKLKSQEGSSQVQIFTHTRGDAFFYIVGTFHGLFKSKSKHRYIPITDVKVLKVVRSADTWHKHRIPVQGGFIGVSTNHIEACTFVDRKEKTEATA